MIDDFEIKNIKFGKCPIFQLSHLAQGSTSISSATRSRVANLPHSRPTLPAEQDDNDDMQEEEEDSDAESTVPKRDRSDTQTLNDAKYSPLERLTSFEEDRFHYNFRVRIARIA